MPPTGKHRPGFRKAPELIDFTPLADCPATQVDALLDAAFGPDRRNRTAYRIRTGMASIDRLSFAAIDKGRLTGSIQCWPIALEGDDGIAWPLVMIGPVAVDPARQRAGLGRALMEHMLTAARDSDSDTALMLIGNPEYYGRFFGFSADRTSRWRAPGPIEQRRLLAAGPDVPDQPGMLGPRVAAIA